MQAFLHALKIVELELLPGAQSWQGVLEWCGSKHLGFPEIRLPKITAAERRELDVALRKEGLPTLPTFPRQPRSASA